MTSGVYTIKNTINGKRYIGSSVRIERRFIRHRYELRHGLHPNTHLQAAWQRYGEDAFIFEVTEECGDSLVAEQRLLDQLWGEGLYNICPQAGAPTRGRRLSTEHKEKIKAASMGHSVSSSMRNAVAVQNSQRQHSNETKAKLSSAGRNNARRGIDQIDPSTGEVVAEYRSAYQARARGFPGVEQALLGRKAMVRGFYWEYS